MYTIGIRDLRANLAQILQRAADGQSTTVTHHGRPAAVVGPVDTQADPVDQLLSSGALIAPSRRGEWRPPPATAIAVGTRIDTALRDLRG